MKALLGIDIGTYSSKGVLVETTGRILAQAQLPHDLSIPHTGWAEHDADAVWWRELCELSRELIEGSPVAPTDIAAVGVSAIAPCVLPVDADGRPLRPAILYGIDTRATEEAAELTHRLGADWIREITGSELSSQSAGPKILWLKNREPERWKRARFFHTSTSYLVFRLTGATVIDHYTAAFFGPLYDIAKRRWEAGGAEGVCLTNQLPSPGWTTDIAGTVTEEAARETGLATGTPVIVGTADAASEAVSAGVAREGDTMLMYGSSLFIISLTSSLARGGVFWPAPFLFSKTSALAAGMATAGSVTEWFRRLVSSFSDHTGSSPVQFETLAAQAAQVPAGSEGLVALPYFSGERTPINDPAARGILAGLTLRHTAAHLYRSILEGVAFGIRHNLEEMVHAGTTPRRLYGVGGGTKNREWLGIVSDVLGIPQTIRQTPGACFGDALLAGLGCGLISSTAELEPLLAEGEIIEPRSENRAMYDHQFSIYRKLYEATKSCVHELASWEDRDNEL